MLARREVVEYGALPLAALCPQLDSHAALQTMHTQMLARSTAMPSGARIVSPADVSSILSLTPSQLEVLSEVLAALSLANSSGSQQRAGSGSGVATTIGKAHGTAPVSGSSDSKTLFGAERIYVHELSLLLFAQLFSKEAARPDIAEVWPDPNMQAPPPAAVAMELLSPTRRSPSGGVTYVRQQQLQQFLRAQHQSLRSYGDYVRRHLRLVLELVANPQPQGARTSQSGGAGSSSTGSEGGLLRPHTLLSCEEVERAQFLVHSGRGDSADMEPISRFVQGLTFAPQPIEAVVNALRGAWHEEMPIPMALDSPRGSTLSLTSSLSLTTAIAGAFSTFAGANNLLSSTSLPAHCLGPSGGSGGSAGSSLGGAGGLANAAGNGSLSRGNSGSLLGSGLSPNVGNLNVGNFNGSIPPGHGFGPQSTLHPFGAGISAASLGATLAAAQVASGGVGSDGGSSSQGHTNATSLHSQHAGSPPMAVPGVITAANGQLLPLPALPFAAPSIITNPAAAAAAAAASTAAVGGSAFSSVNASNLTISAFNNLNTTSNGLNMSGSFSPSFRSSLRVPGMVASTGQVDEGHVCGVHKGTVVRGDGDVPSGEARVTDCHDAVVYFLSPLASGLVSGCSDCTLVFGAVGCLLRLEKCDRVQVHAATNRLVISSCHECTLYLGVARPPCLVGDNRFLRLAPLNARYEAQAAHAAAAGLRLDCPNCWDSPLVLSGKDRRGQSIAPDSPRSFAMSPTSSATGPKAAFSLVPPEEFLPYVIPFQGSRGSLAGGVAPPHSTRWSHLQATGSRNGALYLFPLPADYERALTRKLVMTTELRQKFKQAGLTKDKERELNDAIQGYFKDWLVSSGLMRQIFDLSALERDDQGFGGLGNFHTPSGSSHLPDGIPPPRRSGSGTIGVGPGGVPIASNSGAGGGGGASAGASSTHIFGSAGGLASSGAGGGHSPMHS